jgi:hypothetical protein
MSIIEKVRAMTTDEIRARFRELNSIIATDNIPTELFEEYWSLDTVLCERYDEEDARDGYWDWDDDSF